MKRGLWKDTAREWWYVDYEPGEWTVCGDPSTAVFFMGKTLAGGLMNNLGGAKLVIPKELN